MRLVGLVGLVGRGGCGKVGGPLVAPRGWRDVLVWQVWERVVLVGVM